MPQGIIHVSKTLFPEATRPVTLQGWQQALLLPERYRVIEVKGSPDCLRGAVWRVVVESEAIPVASGTRFLPELTPHYRKEGQETILDRIETKIWNGAEWRELDGVA